MGIATRDQIHFLVIVLLPLLVGCGGNRANSPNLRYATEVLKTAGETIRSDGFTDLERMMNAYHECGLRTKAINDRGVDDELADATQEWANACIRLSNSIHTWSQTPGSDFAFIEGVFGLYAGENPGNIANRSLHRLKNQNDAVAAVERALFQVYAARADMQRELTSKLSNKESVILLARFESFRTQAKPNDYSYAASGDEGVSSTKTNQSSSEAPSEPPSHPVARLVWHIFSFVHDWFGITGVIVVVVIIGVFFLFDEKDSGSISHKPSNSKTSRKGED